MKKQKDISLKKALAEDLIIDKRNEDYKMPEDLCQFTDSTKKSGNHIVIGGAGSGKEVGYVNLQIDNAIKKGENLVITTITEPDKEFLERAENLGYSVKIVNVSSEFNCIQSANIYEKTYNPFHYIKDDKDAQEMVLSIKEYFDYYYATYYDSKFFQDMYWDQTAYLLMTSLFCLTRYSEITQLPVELLTIKKLLTGMVDPNVNGVDTFALLKELKEKSNEAEHIVTKTLAADNKTLKNVANSILTVCQENCLCLSANDNLELEQLGKEKTLLFLLFSPVEVGFGNFVAEMILDKAIRILQNDRKENTEKGIHVRFLLDEYPNVLCGTIGKIGYALASAPHYNMSFSIIIQSINQIYTLNEEYGESMRKNNDKAEITDRVGMIIENSDLIFYYGGCCDLKTTEFFRRISKNPENLCVVNDKLLANIKDDEILLFPHNTETLPIIARKKYLHNEEIGK